MLALLGPLASLLGIETEVSLERLRRNAVVWGAIGGFCAIGAVMLLVAAHAGLALWVGPIWAPLILAGMALVVALAIYVVMRLNRQAAERDDMARRRSAETTALVTTAAITALPLILKTPLLRSVGIPVGSALAAAYFLTRPTKNGGATHRNAKAE